MKYELKSIDSNGINFGIDIIFTILIENPQVILLIATWKNFRTNVKYFSVSLNCLSSDSICPWMCISCKHYKSFFIWMVSVIDQQHKLGSLISGHSPSFNGRVNGTADADDTLPSVLYKKKNMGFWSRRTNLEKLLFALLLLLFIGFITILALFVKGEETGWCNRFHCNLQKFFVLLSQSRLIRRSMHECAHLNCAEKRAFPSHFTIRSFPVVNK
jgi:hypothetical protein